MAISFQSIHSLGSGPGTAITTSVNIGTPSSNSIMVVYGSGHTASDAITSITWNGVALTKVQVQAPAYSNDRYIYLYILLNPDTGTHDLVVNNSSSVFFFGGIAIYSGCLQSGQPDNSDKSTSNTASS